MTDMYYIQKYGVYCHGVYWVGSDVKAGMNRLLELAESDEDDLYKWELIRYREQPNGSEDADDSDVVARAKKQSQARELKGESSDD